MPTPVGEIVLLDKLLSGAIEKSFGIDGIEVGSNFGRMCYLPVTVAAACGVIVTAVGTNFKTFIILQCTTTRCNKLSGWQKDLNFLRWKRMVF